jgi:hypothetical protein
VVEAGQQYRQAGAVNELQVGEVEDDRRVRACELLQTRLEAVGDREVELTAER